MVLYSRYDYSIWYLKWTSNDISNDLGRCIKGGQDLWTMDAGAFRACFSGFEGKLTGAVPKGKSRSGPVE